MHSPCPRHRHFVVFPLFFLIAVISVSPVFSGRSVRASLDASGSVEDLGGGLQAQMTDGAILRRAAVPAIEQGSGLFRAEGIAQVRVREGTVLALHGAFHIVTDGRDVTVSALTAPVFVLVSGTPVLVPPGMQYRVPSAAPPAAGEDIAAWVAARETMALPAHFLREQILALRDFPQPEWMPQASFLPAEASALSGYFPAARERKTEERRLLILGALRSAVESADAEAMRAVLAPAHSAALSDPLSLPTVVALAARDGVPSMVRAALLRHLSPRRDLWLLAALHPVLRDGAWTMATPSLSDEERLILAFGLPLCDRQAEGISPVVRGWWARDVERMIADSPRPLPLVSALLEEHLPIVEEYVRLQYPERARALARALAGFAGPVRRHLPADIDRGLNGVLSIVDSSFRPDLAQEVRRDTSAQTAAHPVPETPPVPAEERIARVRSALEQAGALFSLRTKLQLLGDGRSVRAEAVFFASASAGDRECTFDVDIGAGEVSSIMVSGKRMPNAMPLQAFLEWVRQ